MIMPSASADVVVIGGGFYGCAIALYLKTRWQVPRVIILEQSDRLLGRASLHNQARVHNGYHYPRSFVTAHRSRVNFPRFIVDYADCVRRDFIKLYAISRRNSQISARQFLRFCRETGAPVQAAPLSLSRLFSPRLVEQVFLTEEYAFDALIMAERLCRDLHEAGVDVRYHYAVQAITASSDAQLIVQPFGIKAKMVLNCTYAGLEKIIPLHRVLKYELAEIALIEMPPQLSGLGITLMDGPFFSTMPFPAAGKHSLTHVRYTPHVYWGAGDAPDIPRLLGNAQQNSHYGLMLRDAARYLPGLANASYDRSLFDIKVVLASNEIDDGRPILMEQNRSMPGLFSILGGKIDNIYDIFDKLDNIMAGRQA